MGLGDALRLLSDASEVFGVYLTSSTVRMTRRDRFLGLIRDGWVKFGRFGGQARR